MLRVPLIWPVRTVRVGPRVPMLRPYRFLESFLPSGRKPRGRAHSVPPCSAEEAAYLGSLASPWGEGLSVGGPPDAQALSDRAGDRVTRLHTRTLRSRMPFCTCSRFRDLGVHWMPAVPSCPRPTVSALLPSASCLPLSPWEPLWVHWQTCSIHNMCKSFRVASPRLHRKTKGTRTSEVVMI